MRYNLEFVELHSPLFIDGTNFGLKLYADPKKSKAPIKIYYDTDGTGTYTKQEHVVVEFRGKVAILESCASKTIATGAKELTQKEVMARAQGAVTYVAPKAQVSGPGIGLTSSAQVETPTTKPPKTIIRRAKFQGEESQGE